MQYNIIIGLEVHIGLKTKTKCFCDCQNDYNASINQNICPVCNYRKFNCLQNLKNIV